MGAVTGKLDEQTNVGDLQGWGGAGQGWHQITGLRVLGQSRPGPPHRLARLTSAAAAGAAQLAAAVDLVVSFRDGIPVVMVGAATAGVKEDTNCPPCHLSGTRRDCKCKEC